MSAAMAVAARKLLFDIESDGPFRPVVIEDVGVQFDLMWIDPAYHEAQDRPMAEFERVRRFKYAGAAIAWARRRIFHGLVFGDSVEMRTIKLYLHDGEPHEEEQAITDITLAGFRRWNDPRARYSSSAATLGPPERKCRAANP